MKPLDVGTWRTGHHGGGEQHEPGRLWRRAMARMGLTAVYGEHQDVWGVWRRTGGEVLI
jgi:hypothetical protein